MLLGIDIGTSACKAAVFDEKGNVLAAKAKEYPVYYPYEGWAEQDPDEWYKAVCDALSELSEKIDMSCIRAVGVDGQSWSAIPVDKDGNVLANTPIWFDTRAKTQCDKLKETIGEDRIFSLCRNPIEPTYTTPKVLWFKENHPEIYENAVQFMQSNSFIVYRLTGQFSQDKSQGYAHFFYDMKHSRYDEKMAKLMGIDIKKFAPIYDCHSIVGIVSEKASKETGIPKGTAVVAGGLDAACATLGAGVIKNGQTQEQGGQAGGMSIFMDSPYFDKRLILGNHAVPGKWLLQGGTVAGGAAMEWFSKEFGKSFGEEKVFFNIDEEAKKIPAGSEGLIFLPYLNGERSPIWDTDAKGVFFGITFSKTKAHFARAVMEGVGYALKSNLEAAEEADAQCDILYSVGGSSNSRLWMQIKADITGKKMVVPDSDNASTLGAAILAGVAVGIYKDFDDAVKKTVKIKMHYEPDKTNFSVYEKGFGKYQKIYKNLKEVMAE